MAIHELSRRRLAVESTWRLAGCGLNCREDRYIRPGLMIPVGVVVHDPEAHEAHGRREAEAGRAFLTDPIVRTGGLTIDTQNMTARLDGEMIRLTPIETSILVYLAMRLDQLCSKQDILRVVWGDFYGGSSLRRKNGDSANYHLLRVNMLRLRAKLGHARSLLITRPAFGYQLLAVPPTDDAA